MLNTFDACSTKRPVSSKRISANTRTTLKHANADSIFTCVEYERVQIFHSSVHGIRVHARINSRFQWRPLSETHLYTMLMSAHKSV